MTRRERVGAWLGWGLLPLIVVWQFVDLRHGVFVARRDLISIDVVLYVAIVLVCLPWTIPALKDARRGLWVVLAAFGAFIGYGLISALVAETPRAQGIPVGRIYLAMPLLMAVLAATAALSLVAAMPTRWHRDQLWWGAVVLVTTSFASWPQHIADLGSTRLSPGMGGAAVVYQALLVAAAIFLASLLQGVRRVWSGVGLAASSLAILLSGSRAGMICVALFVALVLVRLYRASRVPRLVWWALGALVLVGVVVVLATPEGRRLLTLSDQLRETNLTAAMLAWSDSWQTVVFGQGTGRVWPWYMYEGGYFTHMPRIVNTGWGDALPHPHSTFLFALVELGIVGFALLLVFCGTVVREFVRTRGRASMVVLAAAVATIPGWVFDTYLIKNFPITIWWWMALVAVVGFNAFASPTTADEDQASAASAAS